MSRNRVPTLYSWLAPIYDAAAVVLGSKGRRLALDRAQIEDGERILELGVGTGLTFRRILHRNPHGWNVGIDVTEEMLVRARRRTAELPMDNYRLVHGDALDLDYPDSSFDCLISTYMLDLLSRAEIETALSEWRRVLTPNGRLVLVYQTCGSCWYQQIWDTCYRFVPVLLGGCRGIAPYIQIREAGMQIQSKQFISRFGVPQEVVVAIPASTRV